MGAQGSTAIPWGHPWGCARAGGCARQGPRPGTLLAGTWDADLQGAKPFRCKEGIPVFAGVRFILQPHCVLLRPGYCCHLPVPWVIPGCQPQSRARGKPCPMSHLPA